MFGFFKKKQQGEVVKIKIDGMHCTSCSMNVDGELEDLDGVFSATTSYAKQESIVEFDPSKVSLKQMRAVIVDLGYKV
jgi:Cu+-exporting ATPase